MLRYIKIIFLVIGVMCAQVYAGSISGSFFVDDILKKENFQLQGQRVRLNIYKNNEEIAGAEVECDANGVFTFEDLEEGAAYAYSYYTVVENVPYIFGKVSFNKSKQSNINVGEHKLFASTDKLDKIFSNESIFIAVGKNDVMKITHQVRLENEGDRVYRYSKGGDKIVFKLMEGAYDLRFLKGVYTSTFDVSNEDGSLTFKEDLGPGKKAYKSFKFSYLLPLTGASQDLISQLNLERRSINVFIDDPKVKLNTQLFSKQSDVKMNAKKQQLYSGGPFVKNEKLTLSFSGLPSSKIFMLKLLIAGGILSLILFFVLFSFDKKINIGDEKIKELTYEKLAKLEQARKTKKISPIKYRLEKDALMRYLVYLEQKV